jgi:hypothetical protein
MGRNRTSEVIHLIVAHNAEGHLRETLASALSDRDLFPDVKTVVVDNSTTELTSAIAGEFPEVDVIRHLDDPGFGVGINRAVRLVAENATVVVTSSDVRITTHQISRLASESIALNGIAYPIVRVDSQDQWGSMFDWTLGGLPNRKPNKRANYFEGCCFAIPRRILEHVGYFDDRLWLFLEDIELAWCARLKNVPIEIDRAVRVEHVGGQTVPGGYVREEKLTSSALRIVLRERNSFRVLAICAPASLALFALPFLVIRTIAMSVYLRLKVERSIIQTLRETLGWNIKLAPNTFSRRRSLNVTWIARWKAMPRTAIPLQLQVFLRHGMPILVDR